MPIRTQPSGADGVTVTAGGIIAGGVAVFVDVMQGVLVHVVGIRVMHGVVVQVETGTAGGAAASAVVVRHGVVVQVETGTASGAAASGVVVLTGAHGLLCGDTGLPSGGVLVPGAAANFETMAPAETSRPMGQFRMSWLFLTTIFLRSKLSISTSSPT